MTNLELDIKTLNEIGQVRHRSYTIASFAVRIDFHFSAPLHMRPVKIDPFLERAAEIIRPEIKKYGGSGCFAPSCGRKASVADIEQLSNVSTLMKLDFEADQNDIILRRQHIERHTGKPTLSENFIAVDSGSLFLGDTYSLEESKSHIILKMNGDWSVSLSFGIDIWENRHAEICALAEDIFTSGIAVSGTFGYALNVREWFRREEGDLYLQPLVARFRMLNPIQPATLGFSPLDSRGVFPVGCWYVLEDAWARENGIDPQAFETLVKKVHSVQRTANGYLFKLWGLPTLGDTNTCPDFGPARALSNALLPAFDGAYVEPAMEGKGRKPNSYRGVVVGEGNAAEAFYRRFLNS